MSVDSSQTHHPRWRQPENLLSPFVCSKAAARGEICLAPYQVGGHFVPNRAANEAKAQAGKTERGPDLRLGRPALHHGGKPPSAQPHGADDIPSDDWEGRRLAIHEPVSSRQPVVP